LVPVGTDGQLKTGEAEMVGVPAGSCPLEPAIMPVNIPPLPPTPADVID